MPILILLEHCDGPESCCWSRVPCSPKSSCLIKNGFSYVFWTWNLESSKDKISCLNYKIFFTVPVQKLSLPGNFFIRWKTIRARHVQCIRVFDYLWTRLDPDWRERQKSLKKWCSFLTVACTKLKYKWKGLKRKRRSFRQTFKTWKISKTMKLVLLRVADDDCSFVDLRGTLLTSSDFSCVASCFAIVLTRAKHYIYT